MSAGSIPRERVLLHRSPTNDDKLREPAIPRSLGSHLLVVVRVVTAGIADLLAPDSPHDTQL